METRRMICWALGMALCPFFLPSVSIALQAVPPHEAPHPGWNEVVRLLSSRPGAIDAETVEHSLGVTMNRRTREVDDYDAWITGREGGSSTFVRLIYMPSQYKGHAESHDSTLQIFVRDIECVSPTRMRADLLGAGLTTTSTSTSSTTFEFYMLGKHRSVRVSYPAGPTGAARQLWAINHHTTDEDRRCVGDVLVTETG